MIIRKKGDIMRVTRNLFLVPATIVGFFLMVGSVIAQQPKFKVGDHVEFSQNSACLGDRFALEATGTIVEVRTTRSTMDYVIQYDPDGGGSGTTIVPFHRQDCGMKASAPPKTDNNANGADTAPAERNDQPEANNQPPGTRGKNGEAPAQGGANFKIGDRVEFSDNNACLGAQYAIPTKGTITQVNPGMTSRNYVILVDPLPGKAPRQETIPMAREACGMRALGGPAPAIKTDKLRVDANGTVLADRDLLDCEHLQHGGRNGQPLPTELAKKLIRCLYEKPSLVGQDGATKMDIIEFAPGAPRKWILYQDMGQGTFNTIVYPVHVKFNVETFYRTRNLETTGQEKTFTCFADKDNLWQCGPATGPNKEGKTQEIMVVK